MLFVRTVGGFYRCRVFTCVMLSFNCMHFAFSTATATPFAEKLQTYAHRFYLNTEFVIKAK